MPPSFPRRFVAHVSVFILALLAAPQAVPAQDTAGLEEVMQDLIDSGRIVGGQTVIAKDSQILYRRNYGFETPDQETAVSDDTVFLIASCSKAFAATVILSLVEDPNVSIGLDDPIDRWLPAFASRPIAGGGTSTRAPTVRELMCHRSGIYSQKVSITPEQSELLYRFDHTLEAAADGIAAQPLLAEPGERFAYSGAGYVVLGRIAELTSGQSFETLLQERVCQPLGLQRTTYFPAGKLDHLAQGGGPGPQPPHLLGTAHQFPLIGGSLYSTATDMTTFCQGLVAGKLISSASFSEMTTPAAPDQAYGFGWSVTMRNGKPVLVQHSGALLSYRSHMIIDLNTGTCAVATWTLANPKLDPGKKLKEALRRAGTFVKS